MDIIEPVEQKEKSNVERNPESLSTPESPMFAQIQSIFGISSADSTEKTMLNDIYEALRTDDNTEAGMLWKITQIEQRIGLPPLGVNRLAHLHGFLKLQKQMNTLESQLQQIYGQ